MSEVFTPRSFACPAGHRWSGDANGTCSVCGAPGTPLPLPTLPDAPPLAPTLQPPGPVTIAPGLPEVPGYELLKELGRGGMGVVYLARQKSLRRLVAVKVMRGDRLADADTVRRFLREIRAAARLDHPNIVHAHDAEQAEGMVLFVMEYVEGIDLHQLVVRRGPLPVGMACDFVRQAALGLVHAHARGLVHRDVKPSNLLLSGPGVVKVADFGLARLHAQAGEDSTSFQTPTGAVMGTPDFVAPEQVLDASTADARADLYSLGCTLYFLLTARAPFDAPSLGQKLLAHQLHEPTPLAQLRPEVPADLAAIVRRLMAKRPEDRFQTPAELAAALAPLARSAGGGPFAGLGETQPSSRRRRYPSPRVAAASVLALGLVLPLIVWAVWPPARSIEKSIGSSTSPERTSSPEEAIAALEKLGARLETSRHDPRRPVVGVDLGRKKITDSALTLLRPLTEVTQLHLNDTAITDTGLAHLKPLTALRVLGLANTGIGDRGLEELTEHKALVTLFLEGTRVSDAGMRHLAGLAMLYRLSLPPGRVGDSGIAALGPNRALTSLSAGGPGITDAVVSSLEGRERMTSLALSRTRITDKGVARLGKLVQLTLLSLENGSTVSDRGLAILEHVPELEYLNLNGTKVAGQCFVHLRGRKPLRTLHLDNTPVDDAALAHVRHLPGLRVLSLDGTKVTDGGMEHVAALTGLTQLSLARTEVTDRGLSQVQVLSSLESLDLTGTAVTLAGVQRFRKARPAVAVRR